MDVDVMKVLFINFFFSFIFLLNARNNERKGCPVRDRYCGERWNLRGNTKFEKKERPEVYHIESKQRLRIYCYPVCPGRSLFISAYNLRWKQIILANERLEPVFLYLQGVQGRLWRSDDIINNNYPPSALKVPKKKRR